MLRPAAARRRLLARLRRRTRQTHHRRRVRGPTLRRAQDALGGHALPAVLCEARRRLVTAVRSDRRQVIAVRMTVG